MDEILEGVVRVEKDKLSRIVPDPNGAYPVCIPKVQFRTEHSPRLPVCDRCMRFILNRNYPCPGVPPEERWSMVNDAQA